MTRYLQLTICVVLTAGCQRAEWRTDGLGHYLSITITNYGGRPTSISKISLDGIPWSAKEDEGGVKVVVRGDHFALVDQYFQETLGTARIRSTNDLGYPFIGYHIRDVGMAVTYDVRDDVPGYPKGVFIIMLRGATR
jgi:hypothetical protein